MLHDDVSVSVQLRLYVFLFLRVYGLPHLSRVLPSTAEYSGKADHQLEAKRCFAQIWTFVRNFEEHRVQVQHIAVGRGLIA